MPKYECSHSETTFHERPVQAENPRQAATAYRDLTGSWPDSVGELGFVAPCEGCGAPILEGDPYTPSEDCYLCAPCAELARRPAIVCLCGSTRFYDDFQRVNYRLTMEGKIVLSVGFYPHSSQQAHGQEIGCDDEQKQALDRLHLRKIDLADEILVLNVGGYIGESTRREIAYAEELGKAISYLEPRGAPDGTLAEDDDAEDDPYDDRSGDDGKFGMEHGID